MGLSIKMARPRYRCEASRLPTFPGVVRPPELYDYPPAPFPVEVLFIGWNPPKPFGGFWSLDGPDQVREELHAILRQLGRVRAARADAEFLKEFLDAGFYFVHAVKCWSASKYPGFGRGAKGRERVEIGEPLLRACVTTHLGQELFKLKPAKVCALGKLAYSALRVLDEALDPSARPTEGRCFEVDRRKVLYTCFPSRNPILGRRACDFTRAHLEKFLPEAQPDSKVTPSKTELLRRAETLEALVELYLRLNGYFCVRKYLQHRVVGFGLETESDVLALRMPHQREELPDGRVQPNDPQLVVPSSSGVVDCIIAEVKERAVEFNPPMRGQDGPRRIAQAMRMFGVLPDRVFERGGRARAVAKELHQMITAHRWPSIPRAIFTDEGVSVRMIVFAPETAEHSSRREFVDLQRVLDFVGQRMIPGKACSEYRGPAFSPWRGTTALIVAALDSVHGVAGYRVVDLIREVLTRWPGKQT